MSKHRNWISAGVTTFALALSALGLAQDATQRPGGETVFNARCKSCHDPAVERAPTRAELAFRSPADIVTALTTGVMAPMAKGLSRPEIEAVALFLAPGQQLGSAGADQMCATNGRSRRAPPIGPHSDRMKIPADFSRILGLARPTSQNLK